MKIRERVLWIALLLLTVSGGSVAYATLPSGNGQTDMAHSVSVAVASDQTAFPVSMAATPTGGSTAANQATEIVALNLLTQPRSTTAVTTSDSTDTSAYCGKGIWVGVAGDVAVKMLGDSAATTLKNVPSGSFVPGQFLRVMSTSTTATNIICFGGTG